MARLVWENPKPGVDTESDNSRVRYGMEFTPRLRELKVKQVDGDMFSIYDPTHADYVAVCEGNELDLTLLFDTIRTVKRNGAHTVLIDVRVYGAYQSGLIEGRREEREKELDYDEQTLFNVYGAIRRALAGTSKDLDPERRDQIATDIVNECLNDGIRFRELKKE